MNDLPLRLPAETGADPTLDTPYSEQTELQLSWRSNHDLKQLSEVQRAYVLRVVEWGDQPFLAARKVGLKSIPKSVRVNRCISAFRELRRRTPKTDPNWIAEKFRELVELSMNIKSLEVARKCLNDLAKLEGLLPEQTMHLTVDNQQQQPEIKDISDDDLTTIFNVQQAVREAERGGAVEVIDHES